MINTRLMLTRLALVITTIAFSVVPARAQDTSTVNLSRIRCRDLLLMNGEEREYTMVFFHGVMVGKKNQMTIDEARLGKTSDEILNYCVSNPEKKLMIAFEKYWPRYQNSTSKFE